MGILKRAADLGYTFRFIRMMVMDWKDWDSYKEGIIDENGKRNRNVKILNRPTTHKNKIGDLVSHIRHSVLMDRLASAPS